MKSCSHCGSSNLIEKKKLMHHTNVGNVGIPYKKSIFRCIEPLLVDICKDCGEIVRMYVEEPKRNWM